MHFAHFAIEDGRIARRRSIDTTELNSALLASVSAELRRLRSEAEANLAIAASGEREQIRAALERQLQATPPSPRNGSRFGVTLGNPGTAIDNFLYGEEIKHTFWLWMEKQPVLSAMVLSPGEDGNLVEPSVYGSLAGSRAAVDIDSGRNSGDDRAELSTTTEEILQERPCVLIFLTDMHLNPPLREEALELAHHLAAVMLDHG
jgi:hypothetical protein